MKKFISVLFLTALFSSQAYAWNAYHLYNKDGTDIWAVECADGSLFSYAGSSGGLSIVGPALCEGHGGIANPDDGVNPMPAQKCSVVKPRPVRRGLPRR